MSQSPTKMNTPMLASHEPGCMCAACKHVRLDWRPSAHQYVGPFCPPGCKCIACKAARDRIKYGG